MAEIQTREGWLRSDDGTDLFWRGWEPAEARVAVAVIHGLGDHSERHHRLAIDLAPHGIATFAIDLRGSGRSPGPRGHVDDWGQYIADAAALVDLIATSFEGEVLPMGHSFGAVVILSAILAGAIRPSRFILSSPAFRLALQAPAWKIAIAPLASRLLPRLALNNEVRADGLSHDPEVVAGYSNDPLVHDRISSRTYMEWRRACATIFAQAGRIDMPYFALQGDSDPIIDPTAVQDFYKLTPNPKRVMRIYPGRLHEPLNDTGREEVIGDLAGWIAT